MRTCSIAGALPRPLLRHVRKNRADVVGKSHGVQDQLNASLTAADIDGIVEGGQLVDMGGIGLLHADGGASAADIAREGKKLLHGDHFDPLITGHGSALLQIQLLGGGDNEDVQTVLVPSRHEGLKDALHIDAEGLGQMDAAEVAFVHLVFGHLIGDSCPIQQAHGIGFGLHGVPSFRFRSYYTAIRQKSQRRHRSAAKISSFPLH